MNVLYIYDGEKRGNLPSNWLSLSCSKINKGMIAGYIEDNEIFYFVIDQCVDGLQWLINDYPYMIKLLIDPDVDCPMYVNCLYVTNGKLYKNINFTTLKLVGDDDLLEEIELFLSYDICG